MAILDATEKQAAAEKRQQFDTALGGTLEGLRTVTGDGAAQGPSHAAALRQ